MLKFLVPNIITTTVRLRIDYVLRLTFSFWKPIHLDWIEMLSRSFRKVNHYGSDYWSQLIYWSVMITMIVLTSINSIRSDTICSETDFQASVALNECYLMLFKHQYLWLLDICNFKLVNIFLFDEIFGGCSQHHKRDYQDHSQQQKQPSQKNQSIKLDRMMNESVMILRQNLTTSQSIRSRSSDQQNLFVWKHFDEYDPNLRNINYLCMQLVGLSMIINSLFQIKFKLWNKMIDWSVWFPYEIGCECAMYLGYTWVMKTNKFE